jgi:hypothetical protein
MPKPLKVYGGNLMVRLPEPYGVKQRRVLVSASSMAEAARTLEAFGFGRCLSYMRLYWSETGNDRAIAVAGERKSVWVYRDHRNETDPIEVVPSDKRFGLLVPVGGAA